MNIERIKMKLEKMFSRFKRDALKPILITLICILGVMLVWAICWYGMYLLTLNKDEPWAHGTYDTFVEQIEIRDDWTFGYRRIESKLGENSYVSNLGDDFIFNGVSMHFKNPIDFFKSKTYLKKKIRENKKSLEVSNEKNWTDFYYEEEE